MVQSGTITRLYTSQDLGEILSEGKHYPYISDELWEIGETVDFDLEEMNIGGSVTLVAVNLRRRITGNEGVDYLQIQTLKSEGDFPHKSGHVTNPRPRGVSQNGYSLIEIDGLIYSNASGKSASKNTEVWFLTSSSDTVNLPSGSSINTSVIYSLDTTHPH